MRLTLLPLAMLALASPAMAEVDLAGFWAPVFNTPEPDPAMIAKLPPDTVVIEDTGAPEYERMEFGGLELTPAALAHAEAWQPEDEMTLQRVCQPPSIVYSVQGPFPFEIDQTRDLIVFRYEYYDQVRLIFMDGRGHPPADAPHTKMGHSIGHWEGDELVIDTTHIAPSTITNNGLDHSAEVHMVERYKLSPDGKALLATQWFEDPEVLENNGARFIRWDKRPGQYVLPYECDPSFALEYAERSGPDQQGEATEPAR
jgi:hypothetical protein